MRKIILFLLCLLFSVWSLFAADPSNSQLNLRDTSTAAKTGGAVSDSLATFMWPISSFFFSPDLQGESVQNTFITVASAIKNFFVGIAVIFLIIGVLKLLFAWGDEEDVKKWRKSIIWTSVGIFVMQIAYSVWATLYLNIQGTWLDNPINSQLWWQFWKNIFEPIVGILLMLAWLWFLIMAVYAFYIIVTGGGDEEKLKKGKNIIIYAFIWYLLVRLPKPLITAIYWEPKEACKNTTWLSIWNCELSEKKLSGGIEIFGKLINYLNSFLMLLAVLLVIYAGWLVFISWGDEEKLKKAKNIIIYILLWLLLIVASNALFRFFILG